MKLPKVTENTVRSLVGDMENDVDYIETSFVKIAEEQPALAQAIACLATETKEQAKTAGFMCLVYEMLDRQAKTDELNTLFAVAEDSPPSA